MLERNFSSNFRRELEEVCTEPIHIILLQDAPRSGKKPYDSYAVIDGVFVAMEFKVVKGLSISSSIVSVRQLDALREASKAGGQAYVVIYMERLKSVLFVGVNQWMKIFKNEKSRKHCFFENDEYIDLYKSTKAKLKAKSSVFILERTKQDVIVNGKCKHTTRWDFDKMFINLHGANDAVRI